jgi:hypothetical protein
MTELAPLELEQVGINQSSTSELPKSNAPGRIGTRG